MDNYSGLQLGESACIVYTRLNTGGGTFPYSESRSDAVTSISHLSIEIFHVFLRCRLPDRHTVHHPMGWAANNLYKNRHGSSTLPR